MAKKNLRELFQEYRSAEYQFERDQKLWEIWEFALEKKKLRIEELQFFLLKIYSKETSLNRGLIIELLATKLRKESIPQLVKLFQNEEEKIVRDKIRQHLMELGVPETKLVYLRKKRDKIQEEIQYGDKFNELISKVNSPMKILNIKKVKVVPQRTICRICKLDLQEEDIAVQCVECGVYYHLEHLLAWLENNPCCPVCEIKMK